MGEENMKTTDELIPMDILIQVAPVIRNTAHPLRLRILDYLQCVGEPQNVNQITEATEVAQASVSQQLRILKDQGVLSCHRNGLFMMYEISNPALLHLLECIRTHGKDCK